MRIKHLMVLLIILVWVTQPVSAGFFTDFFNKITGSVTETETDPEPDPDPQPLGDHVYPLCRRLCPLAGRAIHRTAGDREPPRRLAGSGVDGLWRGVGPGLIGHPVAGGGGGPG